MTDNTAKITSITHETHSGPLLRSFKVIVASSFQIKTNPYSTFIGSAVLSYHICPEVSILDIRNTEISFGILEIFFRRMFFFCTENKNFDIIEFIIM